MKFYPANRLGSQIKASATAISLVALGVLTACGDDSSNPSATVVPKKSEPAPGETKVENPKDNAFGEDTKKVNNPPSDATTTVSANAATDGQKLSSGKNLKQVMQGDWNYLGQNCLTQQQASTLTGEALDLSVATSLQYEKLNSEHTKGQYQVAAKDSLDYQKVISLEADTLKIVEMLNGQVQQVVQGPYSFVQEQVDQSKGWGKAQIRLPNEQQQIETSLFDEQSGSLYMTQLDGRCQSGKALQKFQRSL